MENFEQPAFKEVMYVYNSQDGAGKFLSEDGETEPFYSTEAGLTLLDKLVQTGKVSEVNERRLREEILSSDHGTSPTWGDVDSGHIELPDDTLMN